MSGRTQCGETPKELHSAAITISVEDNEMPNEPFWDPIHNILENDAEDIIHLIIAHDSKLATRVEADLSDALGLLDAYLTSFVVLIQMAFRSPEEWQVKDTTRAAIGMTLSGFNYLLLARLGVTHGYYAEVRSLLRDNYERMSRCMLFMREAEVAQKWLRGSRIQQQEVDDLLSKSLEGEESEQAKVFQQFRKKYREDSEAVHPNLNSMLMRLVVNSAEEASERVGKDVFLGGVMGKNYGRQTLLAVASSVMIAVTILRNLFSGDLEEFDRKLNDLNVRLDRAG